MGKKWANNAAKKGSGEVGFQPTQRKAVLPLGEKRQGLFRRLNKNSIPITTEEPTADTASGKLYHHYADIQRSLPDNVECKYCGNKTLYKLMKEPTGEIICSGCSHGGESDNFIKSGEWIAPSPNEIRKAIKEDQGK